MVREEIARYAAGTARTRDDLDEDLEAASLEEWQEQEPKTPTKKRGPKR
jgi:hypothetical protein